MQVDDGVNTGHMTQTKAALLLLDEFEVTSLRIYTGQGCIRLSCEEEEEEVEGRRTTTTPPHH